MKIFDKIKDLFIKNEVKTIESHVYRNFANLSPLMFDGEKTPFEMGIPVEIETDYYGMRLRAWEAYIKSDIVQNAIKKYCLWVVGSGLKLQADPDEITLNLNGIDASGIPEFKNNVEALFRLFANLKESTYNQRENLHEYAAEILKTALLSGDVLVILRYIKGRPCVQAIDGFYIQTPYLSQYTDAAERKGNTIVDGIEKNSNGEIIAYYVKKSFTEYQRIEAKGNKTGRLQAFLFKGTKGKLNSDRGISLLSAVLEAVAKMDRYKEATIGAAEENSKIVYTIEHNQFSDGENPMLQQMIQSHTNGTGSAPETQTEQAENLAAKIAQTTGKTSYNLPIGARLNKNQANVDINFGVFFNTNIEIIYAVLGIPPEVAMDKFGGAYSGSRAALKSWEYKMMVDRVLLMKNQFYQPFYDFFLDIQILQNKISANGYLTAYQTGDYMILGAYRKARFIGVTVPHIDPEKEVRAERLKLGKTFENTPLTTAEQVCENLNTGDYNDIIKITQNEKEKSSYFDTDNNITQ